MAFRYSAPPAAGAAQPAAPAAPAHPLPPPAAVPAAQPAAVQQQPAATLPPVQAAPPVQPAAGAPAAAPTAGRRRGRPPAQPAAQAAAPAQPVAPAAAPAAQFQPPVQVAQPMVPAPVAAPAQPLALPAGGWLAAVTPAPSQRTALAAVAEVAAQQGGEPNLFPTIELLGGSNGGMFDRDTMNEEGTSDDLPSGRTKFYGVLMTFRYLLLMWPAGYQQGVKRQPLFRAIVSASQPEAAQILIAAQKKYQMRARPPVQGGPEPFYDQTGHPSTAIEALVFEPRVGIMVVRSAMSYDSVVFTNNQLMAAFPNGQIAPTPVLIEPTSWTTPGSKKQPAGWLEHGIKITPPTIPPAPEMQNAAAIFSQFAQQTATDAELTSMLQEWCAHTLAPDQLARLQAIASGA